ncbi:cysteine-rich receptor-like protein kinase 10 [Durio zibethinus]|uniref:Cysteine-rich receptor-like protein kinase 10 n=1 Tax=Durio zibethinus TaxID=66656 RepID=A0A6P5X4W2_DURZI|nr:cysteine-rich receptor-like protein kinase 10 [Durio zibethinus]
MATSGSCLHRAAKDDEEDQMGEEKCFPFFHLHKFTTSIHEVADENVSTRLPFDFSRQSLHLDFSTIKEATINLSDHNKLGQGTLPDGQEVAAKRLSRNSEQGEVEFKIEFLLMARLQHTNLVRLIGFCLEEEERLLIYEFVPKSSLVGIAHYLYENSQLRIIHRNLKADIILLGAGMNHKIADFGIVWLFKYDQTHIDITRAVGTLQYVKHGHFSVKSDVYSFGVLVLETINGKRSVVSSTSRQGVFQLMQDMVNNSRTIGKKEKVTVSNSRTIRIKGESDISHMFWEFD